MMNVAYNVKLVEPLVWEPLVESSVASLPGGTAARTCSILRIFHNRHIGITPALTVELAILLGDFQVSRGGNGTWELIVKRLLQESAGSRQSFGVLLSAVPFYSLIRLIMPIVEEACNRMRLCYLFCNDAIENSVSYDEYLHYSSGLETQIRQMAAARDDYFQLFWADRAFTLATYSRKAGDWEHPGTQLPESDPSALGLLLRLKPHLSKTRSLTHLHRSLNVPLHHREISRLKEGGISGIHVTRRIDDMGDMLLSEFINPPMVLADRLINNGYLAVRRQTKREELRDVLVVGLMPGQIQPQLGRDFIKSCWLDFISRFGIMLVQGRQLRSEFRWLEGDSLDGVRSCQFLLQDLPLHEVPPEGHTNPVFRRDFLLAMGWLPFFLDTRRRFQPVKGLTDIRTRGHLNRDNQTEAAQEWAFRVWHSQKENLLWSVHESQTSIFSSLPGELLDIDRFVYVHLMLFLPSPGPAKNLNAASAASRLNSLYSGFGLRTLPGRKRSTSITWVPGHIQVSNQWAFDCRGRNESLLFTSTKTNINADQMAGRIGEAWRDQLFKEIRET